MSVQSNSGSGGSLEGTPSWSQLSTSPTPGLLSQQHSAALAKAKEGNVQLYCSNKSALMVSWRVLFYVQRMERKSVSTEFCRGHRDLSAS